MTSAATIFPVTTPVAAPRLVSLDVLRGLAILLMIFSGMIPKTLPNWMDHGYQPHTKPDTNGAWVSALDAEGNAVFDGRWKAMTWVDLVFPMFLFSMGAAIPIALTRRLERGDSKRSLLRGIVARWFMLIVFAVLIYHIGPPPFDAQSDDARRLYALAATGVAFLFFVRWPAAMPAQALRGIRLITGLVLVGIVLANAVQAANLATTANRPGLYFRWSQSDTIILVLAWTYLVAGTAWVFSSRWPWLRFALFVPVMLIAHYLAISPKDYPDWLWMGDWPTTRTLFTTRGGAWTLANVLQSPSLVLNVPGWFGAIKTAGTTRPWLVPALDFSPLFNFTWLKFLWVVVPGTIVGDWLARWSRGQTIEPLASDFDAPMRPVPRRLLVALAAVTIVAVCVGLRHYGFRTLGIAGPFRTPYFALTFGVPLTLLTAAVAIRGVPRDEWLVRRLAVVGATFAIVGLVLACLPFAGPRNGIFEGGISKGPPATLSYYFTATGLSMQLLAALFGLLDADPRGSRRLGLIAANGQNPMLVYFLEHVAIGSLFGMAVFAPFHAAGAAESWWSHVNSLDDLGRFPNYPWLGAAWGALKTLLIATFVWRVTRRRIFWRA